MASPQFLKGKNKLIKEAISVKDWSQVEKIALQILSFDSNSYSSQVFLSLALSHLNPLQAEDAYKKAISISPSLSLARQGLASFYEKQSRWSDYAIALNELLDIFLTTSDAPKYAETLQKLLDLRRKHGTPSELIEILHLLLPSAPAAPLLRTLPPPNPTEPLATPYHNLLILVNSPLKVLLELIPLISTIESAALEAEISKRRMRLGGSALSAQETRRVVQADHLFVSRLPLLYRAVLDDPDASDNEELRRETEVKLLTHLRTLLKALPSSLDPPPLDLRTGAGTAEKSPKAIEEENEKKERVRRDVEDLAVGMVVVGVKEESAWEVVLDWKDQEDGVLDIRDLDRFAERFPEHGLSQIYTATHPYSSPNEDEPVEVISSESIVDLISAALLSSSTSLIAHILSCTHFASIKDWPSLSEVAEAALTLLSAIQVETGREMPLVKRNLNTHLAVSLVHLDPPSHHLQALRLLDGLLLELPREKRLWDAKARVLQAGEDYKKAVEAWDKVIALTPAMQEGDEDEVTSLASNEVLGERSWCLFNLGDEFFMDARKGLESVVQVLEKRKVKRDEEQRASEKKRSKEGIEKPEGVEEGEREEEKEERALAWWRLGSCVWELGAMDPELNVLAFNAFTSSIIASGTFAPSFVSLGTYYETVEPPDFVRAFEFYKKAFELDGTQQVAARFLAEEFADEGEWSLVEAVARRVVSGSAGAASQGAKKFQRLSWAWKAIGGAELNSKKYPQAIVAFQFALRGAPNDAHTWIRLGVAYHESGKHVAALKVFARAISLDRSLWYAQFCLADVQRELGLLEPAVATFKEIVASRPEELGVQVVLAETLLAKGRGEYQAAFLVRAEESFVSALEHASAIIDKGLALRVAWKIAADALAGLAGIGDRVWENKTSPIVLKLLEVLEKNAVDSKIDGMAAVTVKILRRSVANISRQGFCWGVSTLACKMRILLETQNDETIGSAWLDLGLSLSNVRPYLTVDLALPSSSSTSALHQAVRCLKSALHKEPMNASFWNALGVLSFDLSPRLAQHALIKSIEYGSRNAVPWANLGLFYLVQNEEDLANQAFLKAQVLDPDWGAAWVGQATLASMAGHTKEAAVLLEHAFSLGGATPQADIGYAESAFTTYSQDPEKTPAPAALGAPLFALTRYLSKYPSDVSALHLSALVLERLGDLETASATLEQVAQILSDEYDTEESPEAEARFIISQTNLGRVRLAKEDYDGALKAFEAAISLLPNPRDGAGIGNVMSKGTAVLLFTECRLGSSLASFWSGDINEAIEQLSEALDELDEVPDNNSAILAVALCRLHWSEGEEDKALSSILDAPDVTNHRSPLFVKLVFLAVATLTSDSALMITVDRLAARLTDVRFSLEFTRLSALNKLYHNDEAGALATVSRTLHAKPWDNMSRRALSWLLIELTPTASPTNPDLNENLEIGARFLRTGLLHEEFRAVYRSRRHIGAGIVAFGRGGEGSEEDGKAMVEKAVWLAPWVPGAREFLKATVEALE